MPLKKICSFCGAIVYIGQECPCRRKKIKESRAEYDRNRRNKKAKDFYNSKEWREIRDKVLLMDGCDVFLFATKGLMVPADTVHHIVPVMDDWSQRLRVDNLISLSHGTHSMIEREYKRDKAGAQQELREILKKIRPRGD